MVVAALPERDRPVGIVYVKIKICVSPEILLNALFKRQVLYACEESRFFIVSVVRTFGTTRGVDQRSAGLVWGLMLGGELAVLQAPIFDGLSLDPFTLLDDGSRPAEVGIGGRHVGQALVIALVVVVLDERLDLGL